MKADYYEILQIESSATDDEVKRAYRKMALQWHPDKNPDKTEEATAQFRLIQEAWNVLGDPQERAYYDRHKSSFLREDHDKGPDGGDLVDVSYYFSTSVFSGYGDDEKGFYSIYRTVFDALRQQEQSAPWDPESKLPENVPYTTFGTSQSDYATVREFYQFWTNFASRLSFEWEDQYRYEHAGSRRIRRAMEKENKKFRDQARREYNDNVRALAKFIQKRDERWTRLCEEHRAAMETRAELDKRKRAEQRAERLQKMGEFHEQDWMKVDDEALEASLEGRILGDKRTDASDDEEEDEDNETDVEVVDQFYCVACEKAFKSDKQFNNHEKSKKHLKKVRELRRQMLKEERELKRSTGDFESDGEEESESDDFVDALEDLDLNLSKSLSQKKPPGPDVSEDADLADETKQDISEMSEEVSAASGGSDEEEQEKQKQSKSTPMKTGQQKKPRRRKDKSTSAAPTSEYVCNVCGEEFDTRNKLFTHVREKGHALAKEGGSKKSSSKKKGKR